MRRAMRYRRLEIPAYAHRERRQLQRLGQPARASRNAGSGRPRRRDAHQADDVQPVPSRQRRTNSAASCGGTPPSALLPVLTCTNSASRRSPPGHFLGELGGKLVAIDRVDRVEERHRIARLVRLQRADEMQRRSALSSLSPGHLPCASCTRFSPKSRWPAAMTGSIAAASKVFETATSVTSAALLPACSAAPAMRASAFLNRLSASAIRAPPRVRR